MRSSDEDESGNWKSQHLAWQVPLTKLFFTLRHGTGVALYTERIGFFRNPQSTRGTLARGDSGLGFY